jgi:plasmid maintenance system antidote protein VapI
VCSDSLKGYKADLSGEMALRIQKAFRVRMDTLMRMQSSYDIARPVGGKRNQGAPVPGGDVKGIHWLVTR